MKPICLIAISIPIILIWSETVSSLRFSGSSGSGISEVFSDSNKLALIGTFFIWSLPGAISASEKSSGRRKGHQVKNHVIEDIKKTSSKVKRKKGSQTEKDVGEQSQSSSSSSGYKLSPSKDPDLDPMKCFPKALCGVSSEVAQISKRRKDGLIIDYLFLMKAMARNPDAVQEVIVGKVKPKPTSSSSDKATEEEDHQPQDDISEKKKDEEDGSEEDQDQGDEKEGNDDNEEESDEEDEEEDDEPPPKKKRKKHVGPPKTAEEFDKLALKEKVEMEYLLKDTLQKESLNDDNWWGEYGSNDNSPLGSNKKQRPYWNGPPGPSYERYGPGHGGPPPSRGRPGGPPPSRGGSGGPPPYFRNEEMSLPPSFSSYPGMEDQGSGNQPSGGGGFTTLVSKLFGFGGDPNFADDPWFQGRSRDAFGEIPLEIGMDETKEILETAIEIGKAFEKPSQCNELFNGCKYEYTELLYMIDDLRHVLRQHAKNSQKSRSGSKKKTKNKSKKSKGKKDHKSRSNSHKKSKKKGNKGSRTEKQPKLPPWMEQQHDDRGPYSDQYNQGQHPFQQGSDQQYPEMPGFSFSNMFSWLGLAA